MIYQSALEEVREAVKHLKHNKASGEDGIPAEWSQIRNFGRPASQIDRVNLTAGENAARLV
jgi:hypothetical protein